MVDFATVVFESEVRLLELQARSFQRYLRPEQVDQVLVIDNCRRPLGRRERGRLLAGYGTFADAVRFVRPEELATVRATACSWPWPGVCRVRCARTTAWHAWGVMNSCFCSPPWSHAPTAKPVCTA